MRDYAQINTDIWLSKRFKVLPNKIKLFYFYLLTHPDLTDLGTLRLNVKNLADRLGWSMELFEDVLKYSSLVKVVLYDEMAKFLWIPDFFLHNPVTSIESMARWETTHANLPASWLKNKLTLHATLAAQQMFIRCHAALPQAFKDACLNSSFLVTL